MEIRKAEDRDIGAMLAIYNDEVENGVATFDIHPRTEEAERIWFEQHNVENHPLYVAEITGEVAGYVSLSPYRPKEAYRTTVELSVYIARKFRRQGVAQQLMQFILDKAREDPSIHTVVSVITSENTASIRLHEKFRFIYCGTVREVGVKFGRYLDIVQYQIFVE